MARQEPDEGVTSAADFGQKSSLGLARPVRALLLGLLHQGLVSKNGLELKAGSQLLAQIFSRQIVLL